MSNYSYVSFSLDSNGGTASVTSSGADSDSKGDSATGSTGLCTLYVDFLRDLRTDAKEQQCC